ncbi:MAG: SET domain-containing protein [Candidatus Paceibacterota bacterium]
MEIKPTKMLPGEIGVFATKNLKPKTIIGEVELFDNKNIIFVSWSNYKKIDKITQNKINKYCLGTPSGFYTPFNLNHISIPWNLNHSCNYNVGFDKKDNFITTKFIKRGEELFWDYGLGETNPNFIMNCKCNSKNCRKIITGNDWKNKIFRSKNLKFMLSSLK